MPHQSIIKSNLYNIEATLQCTYVAFNGTNHLTLMLQSITSSTIIFLNIIVALLTNTISKPNGLSIQNCIQPMKIIRPCEEIL